MSNAIIDITKSEKGLLALALIATVTVLAALGKVTWPAAISFYEWIFTAYAAAKTVQGVANGNGLKDVVGKLLTIVAPDPSAPVVPEATPTPPKPE